MKPGDEAMRSRIYRDARVPRSLVADPARFGGVVDGDCIRGDLLVLDRRVAGMDANVTAPMDIASIDLGGRILLPRMTEAHCHLDKCHTFPRLVLDDVSIASAIAAHEADRPNCTFDDIRARATRGMKELHAAGCSLVRTHVDWTVDPVRSGRAPLAWQVLGELAAEWRGRITLQRSALFSIDEFADPERADMLARRVAADGGVLGAFVLGHGDRPRKIANMIEAARRHDLMLDFHVDEDRETDHDGLDLIADALLEIGFERPVLCGHCCGLMLVSGDTLKLRIEKLARAGIVVTVLPTTNLYLQDRDGMGSTPDRRGLTRVNELVRGGVPVVFGSDNVRDAFCPTGFHDPLRALSLGVLAAHLERPLEQWLPAISTSAGKALGRDPHFIDQLAADELLVTNATDPTELFSGCASPQPATRPARFDL